VAPVLVSGSEVGLGQRGKTHEAMVLDPDGFVRV
jgi:hypothetical protein